MTKQELMNELLRLEKQANERRADNAILPIQWHIYRAEGEAYYQAIELVKQLE